VTALRATGERSLSCYLFQTVVFVALLPAWTLGLGAALGPAQAVALAGAAWLAWCCWPTSWRGVAVAVRGGPAAPAHPRRFPPNPLPCHDPIVATAAAARRLSRVDQVWLALPYALLLACTALTWAGEELDAGELPGLIVGALAVAGWHGW
jgi:hypothetical protein